MGRIILVRHGQASFGAADYDSLSAHGHDQAVMTGAALTARGIRPSVLLQGSMRRHDQTTRAVVESAGWSDVQVETTRYWDEIDHLGVMRAFGETPEQEDSRVFQAAYERALRRWMTNGSTAGGQESFIEFTARVADGLRCAAEHAGPRQTAVVVTSAGPISVACAMLMHPNFPESDTTAWLRWNAVVVNCAVTTVIVGQQGSHLLAFNEHGHLTPEAVTFR